MKEIVQVEVSPGVMDIEPGRAEKAKRAIRHIWEFIAEYDPFGEIRVSLLIYAFIFFMMFILWAIDEAARFPHASSGITRGSISQSD